MTPGVDASAGADLVVPVPPAAGEAGSAAASRSGATGKAITHQSRRSVGLWRDPRLVQLLIPGSFTVLGQTLLHFRITPVQLVATWAVCCVTELLLTFRESRRWVLPLSATITSLSLGLLLRTTDLLPFVVAGVAGIASKYVLRIDGRHIFNPSNFGLVLALVLFPDTTHVMVAEWGTSLALLFVLLNCAFFIAYRVRRFHLALSYLCAYAIFTAATALGLGTSWIALPQHVANVISSGAVLVFAFFMITDPKTSPATPMTRVIYGVLTAALSFLLAAQGADAAMFLALLIVCPFVPQLDRLLGACQWRLPRVRWRLAAAAMAVSSVVCVASFGASAATVQGHLVSGRGSAPATAASPAVAAGPMSAAAAKLAAAGLVPHFSDVTADAGLAMSHHLAPGECQPPLGTGAAWADYHHDGRLDLYVTDHGGRSHLYDNNGDGTFTDVAVAAGVADPVRPTNGAVWADYNNDGWPDLLVLGNGHNTLYRNNGDGTFTDVSKQSGLASGGRAMSAAWGDYNNDGYLDLFIADYADCIDGPLAQTAGAGGLQGLPTPHSHLYRNNGDGTFTDVTALLGPRLTEGFSYAAVWLDAFGKGPAYPDLYVSNDFGRSIQSNVLWRNDGPARQLGAEITRSPSARHRDEPWHFTDASGPSHTDMAAFAMSTAVGDYDNDGRLDLAISNIGSIYLYHNEGQGHFRDVAAHAGVARAVTPYGSTAVTWGLGWADFNNAGHLDLFETAGPFSMAMGMVGMPTAGDSPFQPDALFLNNGHGTFTDVSQASGVDVVRTGRTVAFADYDGDGCVDMFLANWGQAPILFHNDSGCGGIDHPNHWLTIDLVGTRSNRDGVGAEILVRGRDLPLQLRQVQEGSSLGAGNAKEVHVGLGQATRDVLVEVRWPSGIVQTVRPVALDRRIVVVEPGLSRWPPLRTGRGAGRG